MAADSCKNTVSGTLQESSNLQRIYHMHELPLLWYASGTAIAILTVYVYVVNSNSM